MVKEWINKIRPNLPTQLAQNASPRKCSRRTRKTPNIPPKPTTATEIILIGICKLKTKLRIKKIKIPPIEFAIICRGFFRNLIKKYKRNKATKRVPNSMNRVKFITPQQNPA
jgi:hypothetical protein